MNIKDSWTFGIITDGYVEKRILKIISSIEKQNIPNYEIIIVGHKNKLSNNNQHTSFINFQDQGEWNKENILKIPISLKKNLIIKNSKCENICFLHDYIILLDGWYKGIKNFEKQNEWKVFTNTILDSNENRVLDWVLYDHPAVYLKTCFLPYDQEISKYQYLPGYYWCAKKNFMEVNKLNENLHWGEKEDIEWSKRIRKFTKFHFVSSSKVKFIKDKDGPYLKSNHRYKNFIKRSEFIKRLSKIGCLNLKLWGLFYIIITIINFKLNIIRKLKNAFYIS